MALFNVYELIKPSAYSYNYNLKYNVDSEGQIIPTGGTEVTIFNTLQFFNEVMNKWGHMQYYSNESDIDGARAQFKDIFDVWCSLNRYNFARLHQALTIDYNPIENFFRSEHGSEIDERHKGSKNSKTIEETGDEILEMHKGNKTVNSNSINGYNSDTPVPSGTTTSTTTDASSTVFDKDKKSFDNRETTITETIEDISATVFDKDIHSFIDRISRGNIGVVPNSKLLDGEIETRLKHYYSMLIADFITTYCLYVGGVE